MSFVSFQFLIFFPTVVSLFFLIPHRFRWVFLLAASYYFYMAWRPEYALLILASTIIDYAMAIGMERAAELARRKLFLGASLAGNLGILFFFKYFNFASESFATFLNSINVFYDTPTFAILLPVGISFYTFQSLSYTIDVYRGTRKAERHFGIFALYVSFFPQLVAGPIERSTRLLPQFYRNVRFSSSRLRSGARLMLWGFFLKMVVADNSGIIVDTVYATPETYGGLALSIATVFFTLQLFGDFGGYSYIAIGSARILGYDLMENFRRPYLAASIVEFWRRWHISLTSWFQDYVFYPMYRSLFRARGLTRLSERRRHTIVFGVTTLFGLSALGLWHGANWTFILFGLSQGCFILLYYAVRKWWDRMYLPFRILGTFVMFFIGSVFFRAASVSDAFFVFRRIAFDAEVAIAQLVDIETLTAILSSLGIPDRTHFIGLVGAIAITGAVQVAEEFFSLGRRFSAASEWIRWGAYYALIVYIVFFGFTFNYSDAQPFIYFQF